MKPNLPPKLPDNSLLRVGAPGAFARLVSNELFPALWVFLLTTKNGFSAVVVAKNDEEARQLALAHDPCGWWHTAESDRVAECCPTRPRRVLAMEMHR